MSEKRLWSWIIMLLVMGTAAAWPSLATAQEKSFEWERFDVQLELQPNGDVRVTEAQTIIFSGGDFSYGHRTVPTGMDGGNDGLVDISVREGDIVYEEGYSGLHRFTVGQRSDGTRINWHFPPTIGRHTYHFSYTAQGAIIKNTDAEGGGDQLFWTAVPADLLGDVQAGTVTIRLPDGLRPQLDESGNPLVAAYVNGETPSDVTISVSDDGRTITYDNPGPLPRGTRFEVRVQFPAGVYNMPMPQWQEAQIQQDVLTTLLGLLSALLIVGGPLTVLGLWYWTGRDPEVHLAVDYLTRPPDNLSAGLLGTIMDEKAQLRDVVGALFDLAERGYLVMHEIKATKRKVDDSISDDLRDLLRELNLNGQAITEAVEDAEEIISIGKDEQLLIRTEKNTRDLLPFEKMLLEDIFEDENSRTLESLKYEFAYKLKTLQGSMYEALMERDMFNRNPDSVRKFYMRSGVGLLILTMFGAPFFCGFLATWVDVASFWVVMLPFFGLLGTSLALIAFARYMPAKTQLGAKLAARGEAFKKYLENISEYEKLSEADDLFAKYLPYAIAFGIEKKWVKTFTAEAPQTRLPTWYRPYAPVTIGRGMTDGGSAAGSLGSGGLQGASDTFTSSLGDVSTGLTRVLSNTSYVMRTMPSSSSSSTGSSFSSGSSFSGGGFSSGGFSSSGGGSGGFG